MDHVVCTFYYISAGGRRQGYRERNGSSSFLTSTRKAPCDTCDHEKDFQLETANLRLGPYKIKGERVPWHSIKFHAGYFPRGPPYPHCIYATWLCPLGARFLWTVVLASLALWLLHVLSQCKVPAGAQKERGRRKWGRSIYFPSFLPAALVRGGFISPADPHLLQGDLFL